MPRPLLSLPSLLQLRTAQPAALPAHYEPLLFSWMRLRKAAAALLGAVAEGNSGESSLGLCPLCWPTTSLFTYPMAVCCLRCSPSTAPPLFLSAGTALEVGSWADATQRWAAAAEQLDTAAGIAAGGAPPKPLLWKRGGRPLLPRSLPLSLAYSQLLALCDTSRFVAGWLAGPPACPPGSLPAVCAPRPFAWHFSQLTS